MSSQRPTALPSSSSRLTSTTNVTRIFAPRVGARTQRAHTRDRGFCLRVRARVGNTSRAKRSRAAFPHDLLFPLLTSAPQTLDDVQATPLSRDVHDSVSDVVGDVTVGVSAASASASHTTTTNQRPTAEAKQRVDDVDESFARCVNTRRSARVALALVDVGATRLLAAARTNAVSSSSSSASSATANQTSNLGNVVAVHSSAQLRGGRRRRVFDNDCWLAQAWLPSSSRALSSKVVDRATTCAERSSLTRSAARS